MHQYLIVSINQISALLLITTNRSAGRRRQDMPATNLLTKPIKTGCKRAGTRRVMMAVAMRSAVCGANASQKKMAVATAKIRLATVMPACTRSGRLTTLGSPINTNATMTMASSSRSKKTVARLKGIGTCSLRCKT